MNIHLLQVAGRLLIPLILVGCQEASSDPEGAETTDQPSRSAAMNAAISNTSGKNSAAHFTAEGDFGQTYWTPNGGFPPVVTSR